MASYRCTNRQVLLVLLATTISAMILVYKYESTSEEVSISVQLLKEQSKLSMLASLVVALLCLRIIVFGGVYRDVDGEYAVEQ